MDTDTIDVRVLVLDSEICLPDVDGLNIIPTYQREISPTREYNYDDALLAAISAATKERLYDYVIVGNNLGAGLPKAESVDQNLRGCTIILFNSLSGPANTQAAQSYQEMGYSRLLTRDCFLREFEKVLQERYFPDQ